MIQKNKIERGHSSRGEHLFMEGKGHIMQIDESCPFYVLREMRKQILEFARRKKETKKENAK